MVTKGFATASEAFMIDIVNEQKRADGTRSDNRSAIVNNNIVAHPPPAHFFHSGTSRSKCTSKQGKVNSKMTTNKSAAQVSVTNVNAVSAEKQRSKQAPATKRHANAEPNDKQKEKQIKTTSHEPMDESNSNGVAAASEVALQSKLAAVEVEIIAKDRKIEEKDNELEEKDNQLMERQTTINQLRQQIVKSQQDMKNQQRQYEEEIQSLRHENNILSTNNGRMQDKLVENQTTLEEKTKNISCLSSCVDELKDEVEELQNRLSSQEERHTKEINDKNEELEEQIKLDKNKHKDEMQRQSSNFTKHLEGCAAILASTKAEHKVDIEKLELRYKQEISRQSIESKNDIASIEQAHEVSMKDQEEIHKNLTIELESVKAECAEQRSSVSDLKLELDEIKTECEAVKRGNDLLSAVDERRIKELSKATTRSLEFKTKLNTEMANNERLTQCVTSLTNERDNVLTEVNDLRQQHNTISVLEQQLTTSRTKNSKLTADISLLTKKNKLFNTLEVEKRSLQQSLQTKINELNRIQEVNANMSNTINDNKCTTLRLAKDLVDEKLKSSSLESSLKQSNEEVGILKTEKKEIESSHKAEMNTLQNELSEEKNKHKELKNQRAKQQRQVHKELTTSTRDCSQCNKNQPKAGFSSNQWKKGPKARCIDCVKNDNK